MYISRKSITSVGALDLTTTRFIRLRRSRAFVIAPLLFSLFGPAACTASPLALAQRPAFEMNMRTGLASVSIREPLPWMTANDFERLVRRGMERAAPGTALSAPVEGPFPLRRIVWHANAIVRTGTARLVVNIFDGSTAVGSETEEVANNTSPARITSIVESMTKRLTDMYDRRTALAQS